MVPMLVAATWGVQSPFQAPLHPPIQQKAFSLGGECRWWERSLVLGLPQPDLASFFNFSFS